MKYLDSMGVPGSAWDAHEGEPPSAIAIETVRRIGELLYAINFPPDRLAPSVDDGITISFAKANRIAAIECFNTGEIVFLTAECNAAPDVWEVAPLEGALREEIEALRNFIEP